MKGLMLSLALCAVLPAAVVAQQEGPAATQVLVRVETKGGAAATPLSADAIRVQVNNKDVPVTSLTRVMPAGTEVALLIDDGLRTSVGRQLGDLRQFIQSLPPGTSIFVGYMQNGRVVAQENFTTDLAAAASRLRIPLGSAGVNASPYFCVSDFVKHWPTEAEGYGVAGTSGRKARFILMLTNGVDPYNGSVSPLNQDSPYVTAAATDAQRAGIPVSSIYYADTGVGGGLANFSGQSYLSQIAEQTGGVALYQGRSNPVALLPYLKQFQEVIAESYVASFQTADQKDVVSVRVRSSEKAIKVHATQALHPGTTFAAASLSDKSSSL